MNSRALGSISVNVNRICSISQYNGNTSEYFDLLQVRALWQNLPDTIHFELLQGAILQYPV